MSQNDSGNSGAATPSDAAGEYSSMAFVFRQLMAGVRTATIVQIKAVTNAGGVSPVGKVDVQPMVHQIDGSGNITPHGTIYGIPYFRMQGGANAVILDPQVGDFGIAMFADRDVSGVVATGAAAAPGSARRNNFADGFYVGGILNGTPTQYVQFSDSGITVLSPTQVTIQAPTVAVTGNLTVSGTVVTQSSITASGEVTGNGIKLSVLKVSGVQPGSGSSGTPVAGS